MWTAFTAPLSQSKRLFRWIRGVRTPIAEISYSEGSERKSTAAEPVIFERMKEATST